MSDISEWLTIFPENYKFNGKNWNMFKIMITLAAEVQGAEGYLLGTIPDPAASTVTPSAATATTQVPGETPWYSTQPTAEEWRVRNAWTKGLILFNTRDPIGLGVNMDGTAAEMRKSLTDLYDRLSRAERSRINFFTYKRQNEIQMEDRHINLTRKTGHKLGR